MIQIKTIVGKANLIALEETHKLLVHTEEGVDKSALQIAVWLKRTEELMAILRENIRVRANKEYQKLVEGSPDAKRFNIDNIAFLSKNTPRSSWVYPAELVALEKELKQKQKVAQETGAAKKTTPEADSSSFSFTIALTQV